MRDTRLMAILLVVLAGLQVSCGRAAEADTATPTPLPEIRYRDALPLMLERDDLGGGYELAESVRLPRGKGWGKDTTRLSGYRSVFQGSGKPFDAVTCQVESYLTIKEAQEAYRAFRQEIAATIRDNDDYQTVHDTEERLLGEWNHVYTAQSKDTMRVEYVFLRNNVFVFLSFDGPNTPEFADEAAQQARALDEHIFRH
jgi:hypothetical protein